MKKLGRRVNGGQEQVVTCSARTFLLCSEITVGHGTTQQLRCEARALNEAFLSSKYMYIFHTQTCKRS